MTVWEHLHEARGRLLLCLALWAAATALCFVARQRLFEMLARPAGALHYLGPADAFLAYLKIAALGGLLLCAPFLAWQTHAFLGPALKSASRRHLVWALASGLLLFYAGAILGWFLLQSSLRFLSGFASPSLKPLLTVDGYFSFLFALSLGCGAVFEAPLASFFLARAGLLTRSDLAHRWREAMLAAALLSAFLTPSPDAFTQLLLMVPLLLLYLASLLVAGWAESARSAPL